MRGLVKSENVENTKKENLDRLEETEHVRKHLNMLETYKRCCGKSENVGTRLNMLGTI